MNIRHMTLDDLRLVLGWAADEGWNPGLDDAEAFFAADPQGFLVKTVDAQPVAAVSVVNHTPDFAFLGLYICHPDFRGQGHGWDVWQAGLDHAGDRCVGLDGVPDQQDNYARCGFAKTGRTVRYVTDAQPAEWPMPSVNTEKLAAADKQVTGLDREQFATAWFKTTTHRRTITLPDTASQTAFATFRKCRVGVKIGPLYAHDLDQATALLAANPWGGPTSIDVPDTSDALIELVETQNMQPVFETARMYKGKPPAGNAPAYHAVATLELG